MRLYCTFASIRRTSISLSHDSKVHIWSIYPVQIALVWSSVWSPVLSNQPATMTLADIRSRSLLLLQDDVWFHSTEAQDMVHDFGSAVAFSSTNFSLCLLPPPLTNTTAYILNLTMSPPLSPPHSYSLLSPRLRASHSRLFIGALYASRLNKTVPSRQRDCRSILLLQTWNGRLSKMDRFRGCL